MGLKITPITAIAGTLIKSSDYNSNFQAVVNAASYTGTWLTTSNASVGFVNDDTTQSSTNVMHLHPITSGPDRGMLVSTLHSGSVQKAFWIDTSGVVHFFQDSFDNNNNEIMGWSRFTGGGEGIYNHSYAGSIAPNSFVLTPQGESTPSMSFENPGTSTVEVEMSFNESFVGLATLL